MKCIIKEKWRFNITDSQISEFSLKDFYMKKKQEPNYYDSDMQFFFINLKAQKYT